MVTPVASGSVVSEEEKYNSANEISYNNHGYQKGEWKMLSDP